MSMRAKALNKLKEHLWTGKAIILTGPKSKAINRFFNKVIKCLFNDKRVCSNLGNLPKQYLFDYLSACIDNNSFDVYFINWISSYDNADTVINLFKGREDICLIATSEVDLNLYYGDESTNIRGRIINIFVPPVLYEDYLDSLDSNSFIDYLANNSDSLDDSLKDYKYKKQALILYKGLNKYVGFPLSLTSVFSDNDFDVSINTFVSIFNYLNHHGFFYLVPKLDLEKMDTMKNLLYCYPTFIDYILKDKSCSNMDNKVIETAIIGKLINDSNLVFKAAYRSLEKQVNNGLYKVFVSMNEKDKYFFKIYFDENQESLDNYKKSKLLYRKIVILKDDIDSYTDSYGVTYYSVRDFLENGIK